MATPNNILDQIKRDEEVIPYANGDEDGFLQIGYGKSIDKRKGGRLSDAAIEYILKEDIDNCSRDLMIAFPWTSRLDEVRRGALLNMLFNMKMDRLRSLSKFMTCMRNNDFNSAAEELLKTKWGKELEPRAIRLSRQIKTGIWN